MNINELVLEAKECINNMSNDEIRAKFKEHGYEEKFMKKVFLGGTCNGSTWRENLKPILNIGYFDPVVENWTPECQAEELKQREECDFCLYTITPMMTGVYSIAEVVDDSNKRSEKTILLIIEKDGAEFTPHQLKSMKAVAKMVEANGAKVFTTYDDVASYLNSQ